MSQEVLMWDHRQSPFHILIHNEEGPHFYISTFAFGEGTQTEDAMCFTVCIPPLPVGWLVGLLEGLSINWMDLDKMCWEDVAGPRKNLLNFSEDQNNRIDPGILSEGACWTLVELLSAILAPYETILV